MKQITTIVFVGLFIVACQPDYSKPSGQTMTYHDEAVVQDAGNWAIKKTADLGKGYAIRFNPMVDSFFYQFELFVDTLQPRVLRPLDSVTYSLFIYNLAWDAYTYTRDNPLYGIPNGGCYFQRWYIYVFDPTQAGGFKRIPYTYLF